MAEYDEAQIQAAMQRQRAAYDREKDRLRTRDPDLPWEYASIPELLGRAAQLMRWRANAANTDNARRPYGNRDAEPVAENEWPDLVSNYLGGPIGTHCAYLTPAVALAAADWLEIGSNPSACVDLAPMVAVARAYLGEPHTSSYGSEAKP